MQFYYLIYRFMLYSYIYVIYIQCGYKLFSNLI